MLCYVSYFGRRTSNTEVLKQATKAQAAEIQSIKDAHADEMARLNAVHSKNLSDLSSVYEVDLKRCEAVFQSQVIETCIG